MNAVMHKYDMMEGADMPAGENDNLALQVAELRADVRHIQADVTDIKADQRVTHQLIESLRKETAQGFDKIDQRFESVRKETAQGFDKIDQRFESLRKETALGFDKVEQKFESAWKEIGEIKNSLASAKIWALGLYFALAGSLLYVLAKGFKWL
jgi:chromosome segregation ATPase